MKIYKYPLEITDSQDLNIKGLQRVLSVKVQSDVLVLYAIVDLDDDTVSTFCVLIRGTGHEFSIKAEECWQFMGTHLMANDCLVWHVWVPLVVMSKR